MSHPQNDIFNEQVAEREEDIKDVQRDIDQTASRIRIDADYLQKKIDLKKEMEKDLLEMRSRD